MLLVSKFTVAVEAHLNHSYGYLKIYWISKSVKFTLIAAVLRSNVNAVALVGREYINLIQRETG